MNHPNKHSRLEEIIDTAFDLPEDERDRFLTKKCGSDATLRLEAERLIAAMDAEAQSGFLEEPLAARAGTLIRAAAQDRESNADPAPERIGSYRINREIGRGGMGAVYLAERADADFEQQVAVKVIKRGMHTDEIHRRFRTERRILATLKHPNVARLYDGGVTDDGRPFYVMEYVEGVPITDYCDDHRLTIDERLRMFMQVCEAVRYAQQNLVVHRDLKPSNILVDENGSVKLVDFGIAKILADGDGDRTSTQARVLTPLYAAPEQLEGGPITTATDVYALGVVLYELLAGHRPFNGADAAAKESREIDPPSTASTRTETIEKADGKTLTRDPERVSELRRTLPGRLRRRLRGDLDTIILCALRTKPERRYASAEAFLEDVGRHLSHLPITAHRESRVYRLQKFIGRHRAAVTTAGVAMMIVVGALLFHVSRVSQERDRAIVEAAKARALSEYLVGLFQSADPFDAGQVRRDTMSIGHLLSMGADRIESGFGDQPELQLSLDHAVGQIFSSIGDIDRAELHLSRALRSKENLYGEEHSELIATLSELGYIKYVQANLAEAKKYQRRAFEISRGVATQNDWRREEQTEQLLEVAIKLAETLSQIGETTEAEEIVTESLQISRDVLGDEHPLTVLMLREQAYLYWRQERRQESMRTYDELVPLAIEVFGPAHPQTAATKAGYLFQLTEHAKPDTLGAVFDRLSSEVLAIIESLAQTGQDQNSLVAVMLNNLALAMWVQGRRETSLELLRRSIRVGQSVYGRSSVQVSFQMYNFASFLLGMGRFEEAEDVIIEGLAMDASTFEARNPDVRGDGLFILADKLYKDGPLPDTLRAIGVERFSYELRVDMRAPIALDLIQPDYRIAVIDYRGGWLTKPRYMTDTDGDSIYVARRTAISKRGHSLEYLFMAESPSGHQTIESIRWPGRYTRNLTFGDSLRLPIAEWSCRARPPCETGRAWLQVDVGKVEGLDRFQPDTFVGVRGEPFPLTWDRSVRLQNSDGDGVYAQAVEFHQSPGTEIVYQFVLEAPGDSIRWEYEPDVSDAERLVKGLESASRRRRFVFDGDTTLAPVQFGGDDPLWD